MTVVAGPSGSGKSALFPVADLCLLSFNVDDRAALLHGTPAGIPPLVRRQAQKECEEFVASHIQQKKSFSVETTLRSTAAIQPAKCARDSGFFTFLIYVCTEHVEENIQRVVRRGGAGGHSAPAEEIREIYLKSLVHLTDCKAVFDAIELYDTSVRWQEPRLVLRVFGDLMKTYPPVPLWVPDGFMQQTK